MEALKWKELLPNQVVVEKVVHFVEDIFQLSQGVMSSVINNTQFVF